MLEWVLKIVLWIWENISNIDATISIIAVIVGTTISVVIRFKVKREQLKYFVLDKQTRQAIKNYVPTRGTNIDPCDQEIAEDEPGFELIPFFMKEFKNPESQYFIILADSGMGKTTFLLKLFFQYKRKKLKKYKIMLIPLSQSQAFDEIKGVKNKQKTILLLDSFDEDTYAMEDYIGRLQEICNETESFYKVIMTCRTQFFPDSENEPRITGKMRFGVGKKNVEFEKYYILPFRDSEISMYLKKKYYPFGKDKFERSYKLISNCPQLVERPMLLSYIDDLIEEKEVNYDSVYEIYEQLVRKWIEREALKNNKLLYEFSEKVAEYMYLNKTIYIGGAQIESLCKKYKINLRSIEAKSRSLLNRNAGGDYKFAHKSILEFFLYEKAHKELEFRKLIISNSLSGYEMLEYFIKERSLYFINNLRKDNPREIKSIVFKCFILYKVDFSGIDFIDCDFERCVFIEPAFKAATFLNVNFSEAYLEKANFLGANLVNTSLNHANLRKCELRDSDLEGTNMEGANLEGAGLERAKLVKVNMKGTNLKKASLSWANLYEVNMAGADLEKTILINTNFGRTLLNGIDLSKAYLLYSKPRDFWGQDKGEEKGLERDLEGANLSGADLSGLNLKGINLRETILEHAILNNTILDETQVFYLEHECDLQNAKIYLNESDDIISYKEYQKKYKRTARS
ncbi:pentapeptide repeat-containing protein [Parablautia muri]|uniref:Pentapeptide repeat-containing protein n=1 Tax=Parablautia muri TaxID=2320879 RepID=A0A9X5BIV7_9FIRM|nr:pentapeptide repeat-containing protein [Parablautia muri]NBJ94457.1 pentapeptide repeat-containing protein [Parablautia muri]